MTINNALILEAAQELTKKQHPLSFLIKMVWVAIFMILTVGWGFEQLTKHYLIVIDPNNADERCIPNYSIYLLERNVETLELGRIYMFSAKNMTPNFADNTPISKYLAGKAGDRVVQNEHGVFINDKAITTGYPLAEKIGAERESFYKEFVIPEGYYFFTAPAEKSFDSRYWGLVEKLQILGEAHPIW